MLRAFTSPTLLAAALALAGISAAQGEPLFPSEHVEAGAGARHAVSADLDGDGALDVCAALSAGTRAGVLLSAGDGTFLPVTTVSVGGSPREVGLADADGDGDLDLYAAVPSAGGISIALGNGLGDFGDSMAHAAGLGPEALALLDVDADGAMDAAVPGGFAGAAAVLLGDGAGGLGSPALIQVGAAVFGVALADFDQSGAADLALAVKGLNAVDVLLGDGLGGFGPPITVANVAYASGLRVLELNADGWPDLAVLSEKLPGSNLLIGSSFGFVQNGSGISPSTGVAAGDVDGDGDVDLAWTPWADDGYGGSGDLEVRIQVGDGTGLFTYPPAKYRWHVGPQATSPLLADFDTDGELDVLACSQSFGTVMVLRGLPGTDFVAPAEFGAVATGSYAIGTEAIDADHDGDLDLAMLVTKHSVIGADGVAIALGDGAGGFETAAGKYDIPLHVGGFDAGDLDGDGNVDLLAGRYVLPVQPIELRPYLGDGLGQFAQPAVYAALPGDVAGLALADADGDGDLDAVCSGVNYLTSTGQLGVVPGDGAGGFGPVALVEASVPYDIAAGDVTGDGIADLAAVDAAGERLRLFAGLGGGAFAAPLDQALPATPWSVALADLTEDGLLDVAVPCYVSSPPSGLVTVHAADGAGGLLPPAVHETGNGARVALAGDLDLDGRRDLVVGNAWEGTLSVLLADAAGGLRPQRRFDALAWPEALVLADLEGDGRNDLVSGKSYDGACWIHRGIAPSLAGTLPFGSGTPGAAGPHGLAASAVPAVGESGLLLLSSNSPPDAIGVRAISVAPDFAGSDPLGIGVILHVNPTAQPLLVDLSFTSDAHGQGKSALPVPPSPALAGKTAFAQAFWLASGPYLPSPLGLSSSAGLRITIQP